MLRCQRGWWPARVTNSQCMSSSRAAAAASAAGGCGATRRRDSGGRRAKRRRWTSSRSQLSSSGSACLQSRRILAPTVLQQQSRTGMHAHFRKQGWRYNSAGWRAGDEGWGGGDRGDRRGGSWYTVGRSASPRSGGCASAHVEQQRARALHVAPPGLSKASKRGAVHHPDSGGRGGRGRARWQGVRRDVGRRGTPSRTAGRPAWAHPPTPPLSRAPVVRPE